MIPFPLWRLTTLFVEFSLVSTVSCRTKEGSLWRRGTNFCMMHIFIFSVIILALVDMDMAGAWIVMTCVAWTIYFLCIFSDIPELVVLHTKPREGVQVDTILFTQCVPGWSGVADMTYSIFRIVLLYCLPLVFMTFAYVQIGRVLWSSNTIPGMESTGRRPTTTVSNGNTHVQYTARCKFNINSSNIKYETYCSSAFQLAVK